MSTPTAASILLDLIHTLAGRSIDRDGYYGAQCMDLAAMFVAEVTPRLRLAGNAVDQMGAAWPGWYWEGNRPANFPKPGAVVVWNRNVTVHQIGEYGHIALAVLADAYRLLTFDQNWGADPLCRTVVHDYAGVAGWFYPRSL